MLTAQPDLAVRQQLLERIRDARWRSDALFDIVRPESIYDRPIPERHRIIFYVDIWRRLTGISCMKMFWG